MRYALGSLIVDTDRLAVLDRDRTLPVAPKVAELIALLCDNAGAFVSKDALRDRLWPGGAVDDSVLWQKIYLARKVLEPYLGPDAIETLPRRGYRLTATAVAASPTVRAPRVAIAPRRGRPYRGLGIAIVAAMSAFFGTVLTIRPSGPDLDPSVQRAYRLGEYFLSRRTVDGARAAERDFRIVAGSIHRSTSALGYAGLAEAHTILAGESSAGPMRRELDAARVAAQTAYRLDPTSGETAAALGATLFTGDLQEARGAALREDPMARSLLAVTSGTASGQLSYGEYLLFHGDARGAVQHLQNAIDLDPSSAIANVWLAEASYVDGDPGAAALYASRAIAFGTSDQAEALDILGLANDRRHREREALASFRKLERYDPGHADVLAAFVEAEHGARPQAELLLAHALARRPCDCGPFWLDVALAQEVLGKHAAAAASIRRMNRTLRGEAQLLSLEPRLRILRGNPELRISAFAARS